MTGVNNINTSSTQSSVGVQGNNNVGQDNKTKEALENDILLPVENVAAQIAKLMQEMQKCFKKMNDLRRDAASHTQLEMAKMQVQQFDKQMESISQTANASLIKGIGSILGGGFTMISGGLGGATEKLGAVAQGLGQFTDSGVFGMWSTSVTKGAQELEAQVKVGDGAIKTLLDTIDQRMREVDQAYQDMRQMLAQLVSTQKDLANSAQIR